MKGVSTMMNLYKIVLLISLLNLYGARNTGLCNHTLNLAHGVITTPNYPRPYPTDISCIWKINAPRGHYVLLSFHDFDIEPYEHCKTDVVEIKDGSSRHSPLIGPPYCNNRKPVQVMTSSRNELRIWFSSDSTLQYRGFNATYRTVRDRRCGGDLTATHGVITSPRFPLDYPRETSCEWNIQVPRGRHVVLKFETFELETVCPVGSPCRCLDYVSVKDAHNPSKVDRRYCIGAPLPLVGSTNRLTVAFKSDKYGRDRGFKATFAQSITENCGGDHFAKTGMIESPLFDPVAQTVYPVYSHCISIIRASVDEHISIRFPYFDVLSSRWNDCTSDYIEIRDGGAAHSPLIGIFCNVQNPPKVISSSGNQLFIRFVSSSAQKDAHGGYKEGRGFQLSYVSHSNSCTSTLGMEDERISDSQMFATSSLGLTGWPFRLAASFGRLNGKHAWCSQPQRFRSEGEYLQINFRSLTKITKLSIQGYQLDDESYFVKRFKVQYQIVGNLFEYYVSEEDRLQEKVSTELIGNRVPDIRYDNELKPALWSTKIRILPVDYQAGSRGCICMRLEVFGCKVSHILGKTNVWTTSR